MKNLEISVLTPVIPQSEWIELIFWLCASGGKGPSCPKNWGNRLTPTLSLFAWSFHGQALKPIKCCGPIGCYCSLAERTRHRRVVRMVSLDTIRPLRLATVAVVDGDPTILSASKLKPCSTCAKTSNGQPFWTQTTAGLPIRVMSHGGVEAVCTGVLQMI